MYFFTSAFVAVVCDVVASLGAARIRDFVVPFDPKNGFN